MRRLILALAFLLCLTAVSAAAGDDRPSGLVYGPSSAFWLTPPTGWVIDPETAKEFDLPVVFYPKGSDFRSSPMVCYANFLSKHKGYETVNQVAQATLASMRERFAGSRALKADPILTERGVRAEVRRYNAGPGYHEAVAYFDTPGTFNILVLNAQSEADFQAALPAFRELVRSYEQTDIKVIQEQAVPADKTAP